MLSNIRVFIDFASFYDFYRGLCIRSDSVVCFVFVFFVFVFFCLMALSMTEDTKCVFRCYSTRRVSGSLESVFVLRSLFFKMMTG